MCYKIFEYIVVLNMRYCLVLVFTLLSVCADLSNAACSKEGGVPDQDRDFIVNKHNDLRLLIAQGKLKDQPRGVNMKRMKWSNILAQKAQEIADTCVFAHKEVKGTPWGWVGQNLYQSSSSEYKTGTDWNGAIDGWWNENKDYKFGSGFAENTGHYTQVAWADSDNIGCGYSHYPTNDAVFKWSKLYVCHYGPGGNIQGSDPYRKGDSGCENLC